MTKKPIDIDQLDYRVLSILVQDAKTPYAEMGNSLGVAAGTVHLRVKKMINNGIICGTTMTIDYGLLGFDITAFLGIYLEKSSMYNDVSKQLRKIPEVVAANYTTGIYGIFVKIICRDTNHLRKILSTKIQQIKGIQRTETFLSLHESINRPLVIDQIED